MNQAPVVIIGTGLAGYSVARELRRSSPGITQLLFTMDEGDFYSKPMLSNGFSANKGVAELRGQPASKMREQLAAMVYTDTVVEKIDPVRRCIEVGGEQVGYSKLVLALGAEPIKPKLRGDAVEDIISVNTLADYAALYRRLDGTKRIAILGAGLIGCEFANDLRRAGHEVKLIESAAGPLARLLPVEVGDLMSQALADIGIGLYCNTSCTSVDRVDGALKLQLDSGEILTADIVLSAIGLRARGALAKEAGIAVERGIAVDRYLQTSHADIYALGDCAEVAGTLLPYVMPIMQCARALAQTLGGRPTPVNYSAMPIVVKTPAFPLAISPPTSSEGEWEFERFDGKGIKAIFYNRKRNPEGFIVTGEKMVEQRAMARDMPPWLLPM